MHQAVEAPVHLEGDVHGREVEDQHLVAGARPAVGPPQGPEEGRHPAGRLAVPDGCPDDRRQRLRKLVEPDSPPLLAVSAVSHICRFL